MQPEFLDTGAEIEKRVGASLPHWSQEGCCYFVTFRLADSLPQVKVRSWSAARKRLELRLARHDITAGEARMIQRALKRDLEAHLDRGIGACVLHQPGPAQVVQDALLHFDGIRYVLWAWCVMPNHVHVVVAPASGYKIEFILHSWKLFTARSINRMLGRTGKFWQHESFDHAIRNQASFEWCIEYTYRNPDAAGLQNWPWRGRKDADWG